MKKLPLIVRLFWYPAKFCAAVLWFCVLWLANEFLKLMPKHRRIVKKLQRSQEAAAGKTALN